MERDDTAATYSSTLFRGHDAHDAGHSIDLPVRWHVRRQHHLYREVVLLKRCRF